MTGRRLSLALEEGFLGDRVVIRAGGQVLADLEDVSTRVQIGLARTLDLDLPDGEDELSIELPDRGVRSAWPLGDAVPAYFGVSVSEDGKSLRRRSGDSPPGYV